MKRGLLRRVFSIARSIRSDIKAWMRDALMGKMRMEVSWKTYVPRTVSISVGFGLLAMSLAGCMSPEQERVVNLNEDQGACSDMGARYGSPAYTQCMLAQQQRRDNKHLLFLEQARINSEIARNAQEMRQRSRRDRRD